MPTTRSIGLTPEQLAARRQGIGGSDAGAILGVDSYRSALDIYEQKLGLRDPAPPNAAMKRGIHLEAVARKLYTELTGRRVRRIGQRVNATPGFGFMLCNVDGMILADHLAESRGRPQGPGVLELKCPGVWAFAKIKREGLPLSYIAQMQHNLVVTGYGWGSFALFNADLWELIHFDVVADPDLQQALILKEQEFWMEHVEPRIPPVAAPAPAPEISGRLQESTGAGELILRNDPEWAAAAAQFTEADEIAETGTHLKHVAQEKLQKLMGKYGVCEGAGIRCYWTEQSGRRSFDRKALEHSAPLDRIAVATKINERVMHDATKAGILADLPSCAVDFTQFETVGKPFEMFRLYRVAAGTGD